ncbi:MAG: hypothetical protein WD404_10415 [Solirubrobacterales bacterium]
MRRPVKDSTGESLHNPSIAGNGLCDRCAHQRLIPNTRDSVFSLCLRSRTEPAYPRYPRVPVVSCPGFDPRAERRARAGG